MSKKAPTTTDTLVSFNINGIRARLHQLDALIERFAPAVIALQETKVDDESFPIAEVHARGYDAHWFGEKGHYGVALLTRVPVLAVSRGFPDDPPLAQRRFIGADVRIANTTVRILNGYFPQGESRAHPVKFPAKERFYAGLLRFLQSGCDPEQPLLLVGDMNVAPTDLDIGIGEDSRKRWLRTGSCSFLPEEREWLQRVLDWGLSDVWRERNPQTADRFSWFDYRSRGFEREPRRGLRIDLALGTPALQQRVADTGIDYEIRSMPRPSDHCPVWVSLSG